ncbi:T6SS phospholipase effector Tle1-like catalytic domain-containing protein [Seohaeicola nanhaiensis]|uniref:T6SS phospholipase effector Tle1-like catalytic domain-containing protein n=1 Tax=Seohaeicola nanhaiensis TaxID=1387282 RepID=A0ABV9KP20_9RHOB
MPRRIVICIDGTGNEIGDRETNVLKLYKAVAQDEEQIAHYVMGVGTYDGPQYFGRTRQLVKGFFGLAFGLGLEEDVLEAYRVLCRSYRDDDRIVLAGFSRGAYAVRVLAGFIHNFGLVRPEVLHLITPVFRAYRRVSEAPAGADPDRVFQALREYERVLRPEPAPIRALLLFDTVSSILRFHPIWRNLARYQSPVELGTHANVNSNVSVRIVLHALAVDERRSLFRAQAWNPSEGDRDGTTPLYFGNNFRNPGSRRRQIIRQRWFPGFHSDIGGSPPEDRSGIGKITVNWMLDAFEAAEAQADAEDAAQGAPAPALPPGLALRQRARKTYLQGETPGKTTPGGLPYARPDPLAPLHDSIFPGGFSRTWAWALLEILPKSLKRRAPGTPAWYRRGLIWYLPLMEPRPIPEDHEIDDSVATRRTALPEYDPPNLPAS